MTIISTETHAAIKLDAIKRETAKIFIVGTSPLIVHRWTEKAKQEMLDSQQGRKKPKQPKDPIADYEGSTYRFPDGSHGFPTLGFKAATVTGAGRTYGKSVKMTELRIALSFQVDGIGVGGDALTLIHGDPMMREDMVRVGLGKADLRYRAQYTDWSAMLTIRYMPHLIDVETVMALVEAGGCNGVGEWRPEKDGVYGTYQVERAE
jgi:hypothetical protein